MRCPSCLTVIDQPVEACPNCGFTLAPLDKKFGTVPKNLRHLTDMSMVFEEKERQSLEEQLLRMERRFPGLYASVMTMDVHRRFNPREYFFWLVNRCRFSPLEDKLERSFFVVLLFDMNSRTALLTTGYGLQSVLPEEKLQEIFDLGFPEFQKGRLYRGCIKILSGLTRHLQTHSEKGRADSLFQESERYPEYAANPGDAS